jgi:hypothetical protein
MLQFPVVNRLPDEGKVVGSVVDGSLIDEMLRLTPAERLRLNDRMAAQALKLQEAFSALQGRWPSRAS